MQMIPDGLLDEVVDRLVREFDPQQVILFGSRAWGKPTEDSDLDFMVILEESEERPLDRMTRGQKALRGLNAPTDVLVWTRAEYERYAHLKASLHYKIANEGEILYGPGTDRTGRRVVRESRA